LDSSLKERLRAFAGANNLTLSEAVRLILDRAGSEGLPPSDVLGYNDGLRRGLAEARTALSSALAALWK
jgi:antitoxin component of RelBE/YafQ-DinJ toxin-antitoxin module